jgi:hypothetical protein
LRRDPRFDAPAAARDERREFVHVLPAIFELELERGQRPAHQRRVGTAAEREARVELDPQAGRLAHGQLEPISGGPVLLEQRARNPLVRRCVRTFEHEIVPLHETWLVTLEHHLEGVRLEHPAREALMVGDPQKHDFRRGIRAQGLRVHLREPRGVHRIGLRHGTAPQRQVVERRERLLDSDHVDGAAPRQLDGARERMTFSRELVAGLELAPPFGEFGEPSEPVGDIVPARPRQRADPELRCLHQDERARQRAGGREHGERARGVQPPLARAGALHASRKRKKRRDQRELVERRRQRRRDGCGAERESEREQAQATDREGANVPARGVRSRAHGRDDERQHGDGLCEVEQQRPRALRERVPSRDLERSAHVPRQIRKLLSRRAPQRELQADEGREPAPRVSTLAPFPEDPRHQRRDCTTLELERELHRAGERQCKGRAREHGPTERAARREHGTDRHEPELDAGVVREPDEEQRDERQSSQHVARDREQGARDEHGEHELEHTFDEQRSPPERVRPPTLCVQGSERAVREDRLRADLRARGELRVEQPLPRRIERDRVLQTRPIHQQRRDCNGQQCDEPAHPERAGRGRRRRKLRRRAGHGDRAGCASPASLLGRRTCAEMRRTGY